MSAFTVLGVLWFWIFCFQIGMLLGEVIDCGLILVALARIDKQTERIQASLDAFLASLAAKAAV